MRNLTKYKLFSKKILDVVPKKVITFKKSKWLRSKLFISRKLKLKKRKLKSYKRAIQLFILPRLRKLRKLYNFSKWRTVYKLHNKKRLFLIQNFSYPAKCKLTLRDKICFVSQQLKGKLKLKLALRIKLTKEVRTKNKKSKLKRNLLTFLKKKSKKKVLILKVLREYKKKNNKVVKPNRRKKKKFKKLLKSQVIKSHTPRFFISSRRLSYLKRRFKKSVGSKNILKQFFGVSQINNKSNMQLQAFEAIYKNVFLKQFFRVEVLLWKLNFFVSSKEALQNLVHGNILVNGLKKTGNYFLKKGDIITITGSQESYFSNKLILKKKIFLKKSFFPFVEVDFFTKTIVILKDPIELSVSDYYFFTPFFFNIDFLNCFKK